MHKRYAMRIVTSGHLVVPAAMGGKRAAESSNHDLRENLAVVGAVHRQTGDKLLYTRDCSHGNDISAVRMDQATVSAW